MEAVFNPEFPFVAELPKREQKRVATIWERWRVLSELTKTHGSLIPTTVAAALLGVSKARLCVLLNEERLERVRFDSYTYVTENSLLAFVKEERRVGRPPKNFDKSRGVVRTSLEVTGTAIKEILK